MQLIIIPKVPNQVKVITKEHDSLLTRFKTSCPGYCIPTQTNLLYPFGQNTKSSPNPSIPHLDPTSLPRSLDPSPTNQTLTLPLIQQRAV